MTTALLIRQATRSLRRAPVFSTTAMLTLVIGIGAAVAIFALVNGVLLRPLPYPEPDRLVGTWHDLPPLNLQHTQQTAATYRTYREFARTIDDIALYQNGQVNVSDPNGAGEPQRLPSAWVTGSFLSTLRVSPRLGRNFTADEDTPKGPEAVIISDALWRSRFAGGDVVGKTLLVNGVTRQIVGVMPPGFAFPLANTSLWLPRKLNPTEEFPGGFSYNGIARLKPGVTAEDAQRDFAAVLPRVTELFPMMVPGVPMKMLLEQAKPVPVIVPLREDMTGDIAKTLWMVAAAAGLVLLVACANVTNLILVRADQRQRELAVREALGAGRARVLGHFLSEGVVMAGAAGVVGLGLAALAIRLLVSSSGSGVDIPRLAEVRIDAAAIGFAVLVSALVGIVCSIIPALRIGSGHLFTTLREGGRGTAGRVQQRVRGALVAAQIALALVVLAGSGVLVRTFQQLSRVRPGFEPANVATFWLSASGARYEDEAVIARFYAQLVDRVSALPGVQSAGITSRLPLQTNGFDQEPFYPEGDDSYARKIPPLQLFTTVDAGYFRTMGIPLIAGRTFDAPDRQAADEAIISQQTAIQFWKDSTGRSALGKRFQALPNGPWQTIIGVVGSLRDTSLSAGPTSAVYFAEVVPSKGDSVARRFGSHIYRTMALVVRTGNDPAAITSAVQRVVRELDPAIPMFNVQPMTEVASKSVARLAFIITILGAAAVVTLALGAIGLYGVMAYVVTLRTRELGVRIALGATPAGVAAAMTRQGLALTAAGVVGGLALFFGVARFFQAFLYGVAPTDPVSLVAASTLLIAVAALASWIPARRAARVDPAETLRAE